MMSAVVPAHSQQADWVQPPKGDHDGYSSPQVDGTLPLPTRMPDFGTHHRFFAYRSSFGEVVSDFDPCDFQRLGRCREQCEQQSHVPVPAVAVLPYHCQGTLYVLVCERAWPLARVRTPLAARYRELAAAGGTAAGRLVVPDERSALVP